MATATQPYAVFWSGKPIMSKYTTATSYKVGDVIVIGSIPCVAHEAKPSYTGDTLTDALAVYGGIYKIMADGAISPGSAVYWDATNKKVTQTASGNTHFGWLLAGPASSDGDMVAAGPGADGDLAWVFHAPALIESGNTLSSAVTITSNSAHALAVGPNGTTNPTLDINANTGSAAGGLKVVGGADAAGVALSAIGSNTNEPLTLDAKGSGTITIGSVSTGGANIRRKVATVAAAGSTIADAAALGEGYTYVTASNNAVGVQLPASAVGKTVTVKNTVATALLLIYPPVNSQINAKGVNNVYNIPNAAVREFVCVTTTLWYTSPETIA